MDEILSQLVASFANTVGGWDMFLINLVVSIFLCQLVAVFYVRYGRAISNRARFAHIFLPLGLTTMLIMTIVKSNFALSLGLVGALSIVRFRAAIKDPEELSFLFLIIGIGLCAGSNQPLAALSMTGVILLALWLKSMRSGAFVEQERVFVHLNSKQLQDIEQVEQILQKHLKELRLKRMDSHPSGGLDLSFSARRAPSSVIQALQEELRILAADIRLSIIEQAELSA